MKRDTDKFHLMKVFHAVAVKGSFTKGANDLGMTVSSVSKAVQQLENILQTKLLHRTTRSQSLTDSGRDYLFTARRMLTDIKDLEERLLQRGNEPSGLLKVTAPTSVGQFLIGPKMHDFIQSYPQIKIDFILNERLTDITEEGFDLAIRSRNVPTMSPLYSRKLGSHTRKLVASPEYLDQVPVPDTPEELAAMTLLNYRGPQAFAYWSFSQAEHKVTIEPKAIYTSNNYFALYQAALNGTGVANLYQYLVDDDIRDGKLIQLLPDWKQQDRDLYAIYQQRRDTSPKLDKFLSFLSELFM